MGQAELLGPHRPLTVSSREPGGESGLRQGSAGRRGGGDWRRGTEEVTRTVRTETAATALGKRRRGWRPVTLTRCLGVS